MAQKIKFCLPFLINLTLLTTLYSQEQRQGINTVSIFQASFTRIGVAAWGAGGAYVAKSGSPTAAFHNPAGLSRNNTILYIESGRRLKAHYLFGFDFDNQFILPGAVTLTKPLKNFSLSVGYFNFYNHQLEDQLLVTTAQQPEGTGEFLAFESKLNVHTFFGSGNLSFNENIAFGITLGFNYLKQKDQLGNSGFSGDGWDLQFVAGALVAISKVLKTGLDVPRYLTKVAHTLPN